MDPMFHTGSGTVLLHIAVNLSARRLRPAHDAGTPATGRTFALGSKQQQDAPGRCGAIDVTEQHPCTPRCIVCGGGHVTGSSERQQRFHPRKTFTMAASTVPDKDQFPPLPQREEKLEPPRQDCGKKQQEAGLTTSGTTSSPRPNNVTSKWTVLACLSLLTCKRSSLT